MRNLLRKRAQWMVTGLAIALIVAGCNTAPAPAAPPAPGAAPTPAPAQQVNLTMGTPPSSSGYYAFIIGVSQAVQTTYPHIKITAQETGGAGDQHKLLFKREVDFAVITSPLADQQLKGYGGYKDNKDDKLRILAWISPLAMNWVVTESSGVTSVEQLAGKKFNPGGQGTSTQKDTEAIFELLNIKPEYYQAAQADAGTAMQDGRVIGVTKGGQPPDSFVVQLAASNKIRLLGLSDAQIKAVTDKWPYYTAYTIPANAYPGQDKPIKTVTSLAGIGTTTELSNEVVYQIVKGMYAKPEIWQTAYPPSKNIDIPKLTLSTPFLLHAGAVKAYKELGFDVPAALIPPEYKG